MNVSDKETKDLTAKELKSAIQARKHPDYAENIVHWDFLELTYRGGRKWFEANIFKYHKEGTEEFNTRVERAYRFNHPKEIVELVTKYIFRAEVSRKDDAPKELKEFWGQASKKKWSIEEAMPVYSKWASVYGRIWVAIDATKIHSSKKGVASIADAKKQGHRVYSHFIKPQDFLDCGYDDEGELTWCLIRESYRNDEDPIRNLASLNTRYRIWTRQEYSVYENDNNDGLIKTDIGTHGLGMVPIIPLDDMTSGEDYISPSLIADIAYLDRAVANYLSNLDAIIQDQTFSQLAMPAQGAMFSGDTEDDEKQRENMMTVGKKRIFLYDAEGGSKPFFLSPDPKQAELIITAIKQIINEIYHSVGVAGERTKQDNAAGIDNSSGVAKAYDFDRINSLLSNKGKALERFENRMCSMVAAWKGITLPKDEKMVTYPASYDIRGFSDEISISERLEAITVPIELKKTQLKRTVEKLYPFMSKAEKAVITRAIDDMKDISELLGEAGKKSVSDKNPNALPNEQNQQTDGEPDQ